MAGGQREATYLESDEDIRAAIQNLNARRRGKQTAAALPAQAGAKLDDEVRTERPQERPPVALVCIADDGKADGEWVRLRGDRTVIGRTEGDIRIPHDGMISSRHAEITRVKTAAGFRWHLTDLKSTNGTFVRIGNSVLAHQSEFVVGRSRYRFETAPSGSAEITAARPAGATVSWTSEVVRSATPCVVELTPSGVGQRITLSESESWIGRDAKTCTIARPDDVLVNARHARLYRDAKGQWHIENNKTVNGLWLRIEAMPLTEKCQFRLGEQRFLFQAK